jgi:hypothetical protein
LGFGVETLARSRERSDSMSCSFRRSFCRAVSCCMFVAASNSCGVRGQGSGVRGQGSGVGGQGSGVRGQGSGVGGQGSGVRGPAHVRQGDFQARGSFFYAFFGTNEPIIGFNWRRTSAHSSCCLCVAFGVWVHELLFLEVVRPAAAYSWPPPTPVR